MSSSRAVVFALSWLLLAGCVKPQGGEGGGGAGGGSEGGGGSGGSDDAHPCDGSGTCSECAQCGAGSDTCSALFSACQNNASCVAIDQCVVLCAADLECRDQCFIYNPEGVQSWEAASRCLYCEVCVSDCAGTRSC